mgnify:FL=1
MKETKTKGKYFMKIVNVSVPVVHTTIGKIPKLPGAVEVELENGARGNVKVEWGELAKEQVSTPGEIEVTGKIISREYPDPLVEQRADPYILKHTDGYYYFTGSYPLYDRIVLRRAKTISELPAAEEVVIWEKHESGIMSEHIWAPELHYINEKWYIYFAAGERDDVWAIRPYVLECGDENPLTGKWVEKGQINTNFQSFSLDATTFEHNGIRYLIWAQKVNNDTISNLYIAKMSNPWTIEGKQVLLSTPEYEWEYQGFYVNEGPAVIKRNGYIFVAYSASATDDRYAVGLLSAKENSDLLNPASWTKSKEPVFVTSEETKQYGPGHNSFTVTEDGSSDLIVYHARPYKEIVGNSLYDYNRHARVQRIFWNSDGTPYFGTPGYCFNESQVNVKIKIVVEL